MCVTLLFIEHEIISTIHPLIHIHTLPRSHSHAHIHSHMHTCTNTRTYALTQLSCFLLSTRTYTFTHSHSHLHSHSYTHAHIYIYTYHPAFMLPPFQGHAICILVSCGSGTGRATTPARNCPTLDTARPLTFDIAAAVGACEHRERRTSNTERGQRATPKGQRGKCKKGEGALEITKKMGT
jgi:hypothetical protein